MKIEIIKCTKPKSWYKNRIGERFNVLEVDEKNESYIVHKGRILDSFVIASDCKIIENE